MTLLVLSSADDRCSEAVSFDPGGVGGGVTAAAPAGQSLNDQAPDPDADLVDFVTYVFDDVQSFWGQQLGGNYQPADLVLFTQQTQSGCGLADAGMGPFYCPVDMTARLDLDFFRELRTRFGAQGGSLAQGYVLAHEYGHHVQDLLGISDKVSQESRTTPIKPMSLGAPRAASGLLRRGLGPQRSPAATRPRRHRRGNRRCNCRRRRHAATPGDRHHQPGHLDARLVGAARKWFNTGFQSGARISATPSARKTWRPVVAGGAVRRPPWLGRVVDPELLSQRAATSPRVARSASAMRIGSSRFCVPRRSLHVVERMRDSILVSVRAHCLHSFDLLALQRGIDREHLGL